MEGAGETSVSTTCGIVNSCLSSFMCYEQMGSDKTGTCVCNPVSSSPIFRSCCVTNLILVSSRLTPLLRIFPWVVV